MAIANAPEPSTKPIPSIMDETMYRAGPFWAARVASIAATIGLLWLFHTMIAPKLGIYDIRLLVLSLLFATLAVSLNLINGITGQFSIGHAAFYLIGAITTGKLTTALYKPGMMNPQAWLLMMVVVGGIAAAIAGLMVGLPSLRLRGDYLAVATLGFGEIVNVFLRNQDGGPQAITLSAVVVLVVASIVLYGYLKVLKYLPDILKKMGFGGAFRKYDAFSPKVRRIAGKWLGFFKFIVALVLLRLSAVLVFATLGPSLDKFGRLDTGGALGLQSVPKLTQIYFIILLFIGTIALARNLLKCAHGLSFLAVREDELAADATGVSTTKIKVTAFALGAAIAGMAGALYAHYNGPVNPDDFKMDVSFMLVAMVVIGGTGSITGTALAGITLKLLEEGLRKLPKVEAIYLFSLILAAVAIFVLYGYLKKKGWLKLDDALRIPFTVFGLIACAALVYLGFLVYKSDLVIILKVALWALFAGSLVGLLLSQKRRVALPRFGLLALSLVILRFLAPLIASVLGGIGPVHDLLGKTTYTPHDLRWAVFSVALVFVMLLRPQGLLGHQEASWASILSILGVRRKPAEASA